MILDMIQEWFKELLIDGIISNLTGMFDTLNTKVGEIAGEVGMTPAAWNSSIFNMIRNLSETVIVPIAGIILTFVMCYELIQLIIEKNNLHDFDTWIFFKWIFKTFCAVLIVTNTWNIVMAVFDVAQNVVSQSAGVIISDAGIDISGVVGDLETQLADWSVGALLGLWFQSVFVGLCTQILSICIFLVIYGRMIEVYLVTSIGPIPFATMVNREWGSTGQNYLRSLLALGFQAFLIMICVGIYAVLVEGISTSGDNISAAIWGCMGYTVPSAIDKPTCRNVMSVGFERTCEMGEDVLAFTITGNAFLHSMVRTIVGTLVEVGTHRRSPSWVADALAACERTAAGPTAPACGLTFAGVTYDESVLIPVE